jgi:hypothetical protein
VHAIEELNYRDAVLNCIAARSKFFGRLPNSMKEIVNNHFFKTALHIGSER